MVLSLLPLLYSPRCRIVLTHSKNDATAILQYKAGNVTCSSETAKWRRILPALGYKLFHTEKNREEEAEKTPSTFSTDQGN